MKQKKIKKQKIVEDKKIEKTERKLSQILGKNKDLIPQAKYR